MLSNDQLYVLFLLRRIFCPESNTEQVAADSPEDVKQIVLRSGVLLTVYKELPEQLRAELKTLYCRGNKLTTLDVSQNAKLEDLFCHDNNLTTLDVRKTPYLNQHVLRGDVIIETGYPDQYRYHCRR